MANTYAAPNFSIDTSTNVAGLTALKGSAPASTDVLYISEGATVTIESNVTFLKIYFGDNPGGTAAVKNGFVIQNNSTVITIYDTTGAGGLTGTGTTSTLTINGVSGSTTQITSNTANSVANFNGLQIIATYAIFSKFYGIRAGTVAHDFLGCTWSVAQYGLFFNAGDVVPTRMKDCTFYRCGYSILCNVTTTAIDLGTFLRDNPFYVQNVGSSGYNAIQIRFGTTSGINRYVSIEMSTVPITRQKLLRRRVVGVAGFR